MARRRHAGGDRLSWRFRRGPAAQAAKPAAKGMAAAPQRVTSTDPALRLKAFDQHQAMKQASPFRT